MSRKDYVGGCRCGQIRYEAAAGPQFAGYCFCCDCRKSSGSGFIPFMSFAAAEIAIRGASRQVRSASVRGSEAVRNFCPDCGSLVFGGRVGIDDQHTVYAGSLDDPALFVPTLAIFVRDKPDWVPLPPGLTYFEVMPD